MNYRESEVVGMSWRRCHEVHIYNPRNETATVRFDEQDVVSLATQDVVINAGYFRKDVDMDGEFPLLDVETGEPTGNVMTNAALYQALYSNYIKAAKERDAKDAADKAAAEQAALEDQTP
jgi:hypothetical protein